jgi:hypothetical protein
VLIYTCMSTPLSRTATLALAAVLVLGTVATASARPKKHNVARHNVERRNVETEGTTTTNCYGTPIIMQGMGCPKRVAHSEGAQEPAPRGPRRRARGSGGAYVPAYQPTPSLPQSQASTGVYIPPPVSNPSAQINQLNQSFPFNAGLGNNPTNRDAYIRYNLTR